MRWISMDILKEILNHIIARMGIWIMYEEKEENPNAQFIESCENLKTKALKLYRDFKFFSFATKEELDEMIDKYAPISRKVHEFEYEKKSHLFFEKTD